MLPLGLIVMDGWGEAPPSKWNAVRGCNPENLNALRAVYPTTLLETSGPAVGLRKFHPREAIPSRGASPGKGKEAAEERGERVWGERRGAAKRAKAAEGVVLTNHGASFGAYSVRQGLAADIPALLAPTRVPVGSVNISSARAIREGIETTAGWVRGWSSCVCPSVRRGDGGRRWRPVGEAPEVVEDLADHGWIENEGEVRVRLE